MVAGELVSCLLEKTSLEPGPHEWAVFEIVAGGELGNDLSYCLVKLAHMMVTCDFNAMAMIHSHSIKLSFTTRHPMIADINNLLIIALLQHHFHLHRPALIPSCRELC